MDGNGRWAKARGLPRIEGHRRGADSVKRALEAALKFGVNKVTLYAFSVENWNRPEEEVDGLMQLLDQFLKSQSKNLIKNKTRLRVIGQIAGLPEFVQNRIHDVEARTAGFDTCTLTLALNYGSRTEVVDAFKSIYVKAQREELDISKITYQDIADNLYTYDLPDPDLIIRTSGEIRLSNFLLLQSAYAEIFFTEVLWPDFSEVDFKSALEEYAKRERRYGKTGEQLQTYR